MFKNIFSIEKNSTVKNNKQRLLRRLRREKQRERILQEQNIQIPYFEYINLLTPIRELSEKDKDINESEKLSLFSFRLLGNKRGYPAQEEAASEINYSEGLDYEIDINGVDEPFVTPYMSRRNSFCILGSEKPVPQEQSERPIPYEQSENSFCILRSERPIPYIQSEQSQRPLHSENPQPSEHSDPSEHSQPQRNNFNNIQPIRLNFDLVENNQDNDPYQQARNIFPALPNLNRGPVINPFRALYFEPLRILSRYQINAINIRLCFQEFDRNHGLDYDDFIDHVDERENTRYRILRSIKRMQINERREKTRLFRIEEMVYQELNHRGLDTQATLKLISKNNMLCELEDLRANQINEHASLRKLVHRLEISEALETDRLRNIFNRTRVNSQQSENSNEQQAAHRANHLRFILQHQHNQIENQIREAVIRDFDEEIDEINSDN